MVELGICKPQVRCSNAIAAVDTFTSLYHGYMLATWPCWPMHGPEFPLLPNIALPSHSWQS